MCIIAGDITWRPVVTFCFTKKFVIHHHLHNGCPGAGKFFGAEKLMEPGSAALFMDAS
jgi:hypothetical protein